MSRIWEFLGVDFNQPGLFESLESELESNPDRDWQREKAGDLASSLQKGKMGSWRNIFTDRDKHIFHQVAGKALTAWKYGEI